MLIIFKSFYREEFFICSIFQCLSSFFEKRQAAYIIQTSLQITLVNFTIFINIDEIAYLHQLLKRPSFVNFPLQKFRECL